MPAATHSIFPHGSDDSRPSSARVAAQIHGWRWLLWQQMEITTQFFLK
jgi:hypothetical protein